MDSSAISATQYSYQTTLAGSGQQAAVLQALAGTYAATAAATSPSSDDPLAAVAGASAVGPLVSGITALTHGQGVQGTAYAATFGGLDTTSATSLLASLGSGADAGSGLQGFGAGLNANATLAATAYQAQTTNASAATGTTGTTAATGADAANLQAAQAAAATGVLNLLA